MRQVPRRVVVAPMRHPLAIAIGESWRWLHDDDRGTVTLLHSTGLHAVIPVYPLIKHSQEAEMWSEIGEDLKARIRNGETGRLVFAEIIRQQTDQKS